MPPATAGSSGRWLSGSEHEEIIMLVKEAMSRDVKTVSPDQNIQEAARIMLDIDAGSLPVGENDKLVGMVTDRDIAVRGVAAGKAPSAPVREVMSAEVKYCFEDEDTAHVARNMAEQQVRRLPATSPRRRRPGRPPRRCLESRRRVALIRRRDDPARTDDGYSSAQGPEAQSGPRGRHSQDAGDLAAIEGTGQERGFEQDREEHQIAQPPPPLRGRCQRLTLTEGSLLVRPCLPCGHPKGAKSKGARDSSGASSPPHF
jgi:CBS domain-containing protein